MYCHICGTKSSPGDSTCRKCNTKLKDASSTEEQIWAETAVGLEKEQKKQPNYYPGSNSLHPDRATPVKAAHLVGSFHCYLQP